MTALPRLAWHSLMCFSIATRCSGFSLRAERIGGFGFLSPTMTARSVFHTLSISYTAVWFPNAATCSMCAVWAARAVSVMVSPRSSKSERYWSAYVRIILFSANERIWPLAHLSASISVASWLRSLARAMRAVVAICVGGSAALAFLRFDAAGVLVADTAGALAASLLRGRLRAVAGGADGADGADGAAPALAAGRWRFTGGARDWGFARSSSRLRFVALRPLRKDSRSFFDTPVCARSTERSHP